MAKKQKQQNSKSTEVMAPWDAGISRDAEAALTKREQIQFLTLAQGSSDAVMKNEPKGIRAGMYLLGKTKLLEDVTCVVSISRPRAMIFEDGKVTLETFDPSSEEWSKCKATRKGGNTGLEFLLWIPEEECFATFYFKNTAKEVGADAARCRDNKKLCKLTARLVEGKENSWHVPVVTEVDQEDAITLPTKEQQAEAVASFDSYKQEKKAPVKEGARPR